MTTAALHPPLEPGQPAPAFALPSVDRPEPVSLDDYRGRTPLFLALMVGLWCPFCRRQIAQLASLDAQLKPLGVESLVVVATAPENARVYFKFRPTPLRLASDPELTIHRAYGVPKPEPTPEMLAAMDQLRVNPFGALPEPLPLSQAGRALDALDGYVHSAADKVDVERQWPQLKGQFLIDRAGIVRWVDIECAKEGLAGIGKMPPAEVVLAAARAMVMH
jgi:peroxiredoxin